MKRFVTATCRCDMLLKKNPVHYDYHLGHVDLQFVNEEKDFGVTIISKLMWEIQGLMVTAKVNKLLFLLPCTCPMLTVVKVRRSLYLALVKSQMSYATEVWSPSHLTEFREELHAGFYKSSNVTCPTKRD